MVYSIWAALPEQGNFEGNGYTEKGEGASQLGILWVGCLGLGCAPWALRVSGSLGS